MLPYALVNQLSDGAMRLEAATGRRRHALRRGRRSYKVCAGFCRDVLVKRTAAMREHYQMGIFDAVVVAMVFRLEQ